MKRLISFCASLAFLLGVFGSAKAAIIADFGELTTLPETVDISLRIVSGDELPGGSEPDSSVFFIDDYTFSLVGSGDLTSVVANFNLTIPITGFDVSVFSGTPVGSSTDQGATTNTIGGGLLVEIALAGLMSGDYFIRVKGNSVGQYFGTVTVVPIPPAAILFLSALAGLAGFSRIRRRRKSGGRAALGAGAPEGAHR